MKLPAALLALLLLPSAGPLRAQTPMDYFEFGKFMNQTNYPEIWNNENPDEIPGTLRHGRDLLVTLRPPADLLASYDTFAAQLRTLPLTHRYNTWTQDQQNTWNNANLDFNLRDRWLGSPRSPAFFWFWLGFESDYCGQMNLDEVLDWGTNPNDIRTSVTEAVNHFAQLAKSPLLSQLAQDPAEAVQAIAALKGKLETSGNGLEQQDLNTLQQQGAAILSANDNQKAGSTGSLIK
jgi:hypothetical protein